MNLELVTDRIRTKVGENCGLNATIKFVLDDGEFIFVDALTVPNTVSNQDLPALCTIKVTKQNMYKLMEGEMNSYTAFMMGKVKVEGDMGIAMNINKII